VFTGLVQAVGKLRKIDFVAQNAKLGIEAQFSDIALGESIAVRGICLSVVKFEQGYFEVQASEESLRRTSLRSLRVGSLVNLERALRLGDRLGGHWVMGHVDAIGKVTAVHSEGMGEIVRIALDGEHLRYVVQKGSITIDGVSLTVNDVGSEDFSVSLIPITRQHTDGNMRKLGAEVNIEVDVLGKYIESLLKPRSEHAQNSGINLEKLQNAGFLI
jgi:riboflavin synthase